MLEELARLAEGGIHPKAEMPFRIPWTDQPPGVLGRALIQHHLLHLAQWRPEEWAFNPVVISQGRVIGTQSMYGHAFCVTRSFHTGSWLGREYQGNGLGREMRAAVLHFGFIGLGAREATSAAFRDNPASLGVSRSLGYEPNGFETVARRGQPAETLGLRLTRPRWEAVARPEVELSGVEPCLELFGVGASATVPAGG